MALTDALSSVSGIAGQVANGAALLNAFLVTVQKVNFDVKEQGGMSFLFAFKGDESVDLSSDITEHFSETNQTLNDDVALHAPVVSVRGFIGELGNQSNGILAVARAISTQLTVLSPYQPGLTASALEAYNTAQQLLDTAATAATAVEQAYDLAVGKDFENKQQKAYRFFEDRWSARALFTVQTPWKIFKDMIIKNVRPTQGEDTAGVTEFQVTFQQMRFAFSELSASAISQGRRSAQASEVVDHGPQNPPFVGPLNVASRSGL